MGAQPPEQRLIRQVPAVLAGVLDVPIRDLDVRPVDPAGLIVSARHHTFLVEVLGTNAPGAVSERAWQVARAAKKLRRQVTPLVAVPYMTSAAAGACFAARVSWFDLSGNAWISSPTIRVFISGQPNRFRSPGRPASAFAPKSARVARLLLIRPRDALTQREIAQATGMTEGFVSRIVSRLEAEGYLARSGNGPGQRGKAPVRVRDPSLLLDAWLEEYRFFKHTLIQGHVAARSGEALAQSVAEALAAEKVEHAATGLAAAWQMTHFAAFRVATFFVGTEPSAELKDKLGFREDPRGANLWLAVPNDAGVFHGAEEQAGLRCVHPVQAYLDLKEHPERAGEAALRLRSHLLRFDHA